MSLDGAIRALTDGQFVVVTDEVSGVSELVMSGRAVTPDRVAFMASTGGIVGIATTRERCDELGLPPMPERGRVGDELGYHFTFDARLGVSTGISSFDRATTILVASDPDAGADDIVKPGHVLPAAARSCAVLERCGLTEAAIQLAQLADFFPVMARCALLDQRGALLAGAELDEFCERESLERASIEEIRDFGPADLMGAIGGTGGI